MHNDFKVTNYPLSQVSPEQYGRHLSRLFDGNVVDGFKVEPVSGLKVRLTPGSALIRYGTGGNASARLVSLVDNFELTHEAPDASNPRLDAIVVYIDNSVEFAERTPDGAGAAKATIVKGAPNANPQPPTATAIQAQISGDNPYFVAAHVRVDSTVLSQGKVADVRPMTTPRAGSVTTPALADASVTPEKVKWGSTLAPWTDRVAAYQSTSSTEFIDLATVGPTVSVTVERPTLVLVILSARIWGSVNSRRGDMSFAASGATVIAPTSDNALLYEGSADDQFQGSYVMPLVLNAGTTQLQAKYRGFGSSGNANFQDRKLMVVPVMNGDV